MDHKQLFCHDCGEPLPEWGKTDELYNRWMETGCSVCGATPADSERLDAEMVFSTAIANALGAVALSFELLGVAVRLAIFELRFDCARDKADECDAMLAPLSFWKQVQMFGEVAHRRAPEQDLHLKTLKRRLQHCCEARNVRFTPGGCLAFPTSRRQPGIAVECTTEP